MKKKLNDILDEMTPEELDRLSTELNSEHLPNEVVSSIKEKVYAKTNIVNTAKIKSENRTPMGVWIRMGALVACFALIIGAIALLPTFREDDPSDVINTDESLSFDNDKGTSIVPSAATTVAAATVAATKKEGTPQKPMGDSSFGGEGAPPPMFLFDQPEDFSKFVGAASKSAKEFEEYYNTEIYTGGILIYAFGRAAVAHNMEIVYLPVTSADITFEGFGATYDLYLNTLDITYRIDGVSYRFIYWYNNDTLPALSESLTLVKEGVRIGENLIDLYASGDRLIGYFLDGSVRVGIVINTSDFASVSLDSFDMVPVASIK